MLLLISGCFPEEKNILREIKGWFISSRREDTNTLEQELQQDIEKIVAATKSVNALKESQMKIRKANDDNVGVLNIMRNLQNEIQVS